MIATPGSLQALVDQLVVLEQQVADAVGTTLSNSNLLRVYRWQPNQPQPPCCWNWLGNSPFEIRDIQRWRDNVQVLVRFGIQHTDVDQEMGDLEIIADYARDVMDNALAKRHPQLLAGAATWAARQSMRTAVWDISGVQLLGLEFSIQAQLDRQILPS